MFSCHALFSRLDAYVDGELPLTFLLDADCHLAQCRDCAARVRFERSFRACIRDVIVHEAAQSKALERRIRRALFAERAYHKPSCLRATGRPVATAMAARSVVAHRMPPLQALFRSSKNTTWPDNWQRLSWQVGLPIAAIALAAICWTTKNGSVALSRQSVPADLSLSQLDTILDLMTERHSEERPQSIPYQPLQVSVETALMPPFALPPMQDERNLHVERSTGSHGSSSWASSLVGQSAPYTIDGHRATFFMYRAQTAPLRARLDGRILNGQVVYTGTHQGYSIATVEAGSIGYAMASDLSPTQNAQIMLSAVSNSSRPSALPTHPDGAWR